MKRCPVPIAAGADADAAHQRAMGVVRGERPPTDRFAGGFSERILLAVSGGARWGTGRRSAVGMARFNRLRPESAAELLWQCLPVDRWVETIVDGRRYASLDDLFEVARQAALPFTGAELEAGLAGRGTPQFLSTPRGGEAVGEARIGEQLAAGFCTYEQRFGRPFLIRTAGRLPAQILVQLWDRLGHDVDTEDKVLAQQLRELALLELAARVSA